MIPINGERQNRESEWATFLLSTLLGSHIAPSVHLIVVPIQSILIESKCTSPSLFFSCSSFPSIGETEALTIT